MIDVSELRVNSWYLLEDKYYKLFFIDQKLKLKADNGMVSNVDVGQLEGIPLDIETLGWLGFNKDGTHKTYHIAGLHLMEGDNGWRMYLRAYINTKEMTHVHQVQNLYYALKGEELLFEPKVTE